MTEDDDRDEDDPTPMETPVAKKSGQHRMGFVKCPKCGGAFVPCTLCVTEDGTNARVVAVDVGIAWTLEHGDTVPPTERNDK